MYQQVASGGLLDLINLRDYDNRFSEGQMVKLELDLRTSVSPDLAADIESQLRERGAQDCTVRVGSPLMIIEYRKGFPWLAVIVAIILAAIVLAILILGWRLFKEVVPASLQPYVILGALLIGAVLVARKVIGRQT